MILYEFWEFLDPRGESNLLFEQEEHTVENLAPHENTKGSSLTANYYPVRKIS